MAVLERETKSSGRSKIGVIWRCFASWDSV